MHAINQITISLQEQIALLDATAQNGGKQLSAAIINAHALLVETRALAKSLNNNQLTDFFNANVVILSQLHQLVPNPDPTSPLLEKSTAIMQQLSMMYQEAVVPMLTRLHNLSSETEDMQKITAITSLGNEIITYSAQINQFSDKFTIQEKIVAIFGIVLMLSSISLMVAILSKASIEIPILTALIIVAMGCSVCRKAMLLHRNDPGVDLIFTSVKKMEPLIYDIAKNSPEEQARLKIILQNGVESTAPSQLVAQPVTKPAPKTLTQPIIQAENKPEPQPEATAAESTEESNPTFMGKLKGVFDMFNTKK